MRIHRLVGLCCVISAMISSATTIAQPPSDSLAAGFAESPMEVRPRVWWHWLNGAMSEQGIKLDLAWMC